MKDEFEEESSHRLLVWVCIAVPLLYVLSVGPVVAMVNGNPRSTDTARRIYAPVIWLHDHTPLRVPLDKYVALWE